MGQREMQLHVFAKLGENCLELHLASEAFWRGGLDIVLDFGVGESIDISMSLELYGQPAPQSALGVLDAARLP